MAEFCRSQLLRETDFAATRLNGLMSGHIFGRDDAAWTTRPTARCSPRPWARSAWPSRPTRGCSGSPTRCTWARWNVRRPIWTRPGGAADLEILTEPRELPFDAAGNLQSINTAMEFALTIDLAPVPKIRVPVARGLSPRG